MNQYLPTLAILLLFFSFSKSLARPFDSLNTLHDPYSNQIHNVNQKKDGTALLTAQDESTLDMDNSFLPMAQKYMDTLNNEFTAFSPVGLGYILSLLSKMVDAPSPTFNELNEWLGPLASAPNSFFTEYATTLKQANVISATYFFNRGLDVQSMPEEQKNILAETGTLVYNDAATLNHDIQEVSEGQIKNVNLPTDEDITVLLNIFTLQFQWFRKWKVIENIPFYQGTEKKFTSFLNFDGRMKTAYEYDTFEACRLDLFRQPAQSELLVNVFPELDYKTASSPYLNKDVAVYLIKLKSGKQLTRNIFKKVHTQLENNRLGDIEVSFPRFRLEQTTKFSSEEFPHLLQGTNTHFSKWSPQLKLQLQQRTQMCADENGIAANSVTEAFFVLLSNQEPMVFNSKFHVAIVHRPSGEALFIGSVDLPQVMDANERC